MITAEQWSNTRFFIANKQRTRRGYDTTRFQDVAKTYHQDLVGNIVANEEGVRAQFFGLSFFVFGAKIDDGRKSLRLCKLLEHVEPVAITQFTSQQNDVIARTREFVWKIPGGNWIECGDFRVRPVRGHMV